MDECRANERSESELEGESHSIGKFKRRTDEFGGISRARVQRCHVRRAKKTLRRAFLGRP